MVYSIHFSPTGGTAKVTDTIAEQLGDTCSIDLCDHQIDMSARHFKANDVLVIGVPSFRGRVPALAAQRLARANGNGARAILVCVYGNREFDDTLVELQDICENADLQVVAAVAALAQHSELKSLAQGRPDEKDRQMLQTMASQIKAKLEADDRSTPLIPGNRPYKPDNAVVVPPVTADTCTRCRTCATMCPSQAISYANPKTTDASKCISCMRCIKVCPANARSLEENVAKKIATFLKPYQEVRKEPQIWM